MNAFNLPVIPPPGRIYEQGFVEPLADFLGIPERLVRENSIAERYKMKEAVIKNTPSSYFGYKEFESNVALFGIEIEVEGRRLPEKVKFFETKNDGSLRGESFEYVFNKPLNLSTSIKAIEGLVDAFKDRDTVLDMSYRTSVHVHVNVSNLEKNSISVFLYVTFLLEKILVKYCGDIREGNRFCLRMVDAEYKLDELARFISGKGFLIDNQNTVKYSAINIHPISTQGSVEFRSMKGTVDVKTLTDWLSALNNIYEYAKRFETIKQVSDHYENIGPEEFGKEAFHNVFKEFQYKGFDKDIEEMHTLMVSIPYI